MSTVLAPPAEATETAPMASPRRRPLHQLVLPAVVVGVVTAVVGLDRRSLWLDESFSVAATNQMAETITGTAGNMAGYYALLDVWTTVSPSVWWVRLLSVAFAVAAVVPLGALAQRLGGDALAVRATLALALAAQTTRYAQEARAYSLVILVVAASWWVFVLAATEPDAGRRRWLGRLLAGLAVAAVLAHGLAVLNLVAIGLAAALCPERARALRVAAGAVVAAGATVAMLLAGGADGLATWVPDLSLDQVAAAAGRYTSPWWWVALPLGGLVVVGAGDALLGSRRDPVGRWLALLPVLWVVVPVAGLLALSVTRPLFDARYMIGITPGLALLLARGTLVVDGRLRGRNGVVGLAGLVAVALLLPGQFEVHREDGDDWRGAAALVAREARPGDGLLFADRAHRVPFEAAWVERPRPIAPVPVGADRPLGRVLRHDEPRPATAVRQLLATMDRVWLVVGHEPGMDPRLVEAALSQPGVKGELRVVAGHRVDARVEVLLLERSA